MKRLPQLGKLAEAVVALIVFARLPYAWWWLPALFLAPALAADYRQALDAATLPAQTQGNLLTAAVARVRALGGGGE